ncbi:hypothetical protein Poli38472_014218 [Pythium oligandrum]|uniref:Progesterone-induced-blocking factor 1 n=1 Tax=Pythium oligandrum TaxID=41045 RepID=A0A8K1CIA3_PYTOL|nr:hypothetical protein Poli38472_014218 [Pythium oligandrum]|eukprot:TMW64101.1 hypothetical protein Poli38472_014218 [Pythium oligandrum]
MRRSQEETENDADTRSFRRLAMQLGLSQQLQSIDELAFQERPAESERLDDDDDDEHGDGDGESKFDLALTPLRSDSASDSLSSDLSLPRSFGKYDATRRRPTFDDQLQVRSRSGFETTVRPLVTDGEGGQDMLRKFYEAQVDKIRTQLTVTTQAHRRLEATVQDERQQWERQRTELENALATAQKDHASEKETLVRELAEVRKRLEMEKTHLHELQISDALAEQLGRQDAGELSVKEALQLQVHRKVRSVERELETTRKELETLQQLCASYKTHASTASEEIAQVNRVAEAKEQRLQHELELSEASRHELERQVTSLYAQLELLKEAQQKQESETRRPTVDVYSENERLQAEVEHAKEKHRVLEDKYALVVTQMEALEQQVALLTADKAFLQDMKRQLEDQETRLLAKQKEMQTRIEALTTTQSHETQALAHVHEETRLHFEKQLETELHKMIELSKREIEAIRNTSQVVYERENRLLKDARDDALKQIELLQTRLHSVQSTLDEQILERTRLESTHSVALASLRNELKMKHFEMNQLALSLEERSKELRSAQLHVEMLEQKVQVHQEEFARLEATSTTRITQLEASLETQTTKLQEYEQLEVDLDDGILQTGAVLDDTQPVTDVLKTFGAIPTTTKRRFQQSVLLAQRVVKAQKEAMELRQQLEFKTRDHAQLAIEIAGLKHQLAHLHQPQAYLIEKLNRMDEELTTMRRRKEALEKQLEELRAEYQSVNAARMSIQSQLQQVLARREEMETLKTTVLAMRKKLQTREASEATTTPPLAVKNPPSPAVLAQMLRPPTPQKPTDDAPETPSPPKWYVQMRS